MQYIAHYDIAAFVVYTFIIVAFYGRKVIPSKANRSFSTFMFAGLAAVVLDLFSLYTLKRIGTTPLWINYLVNIGVFVSMNFLYLTYFVYLTNATLNNKEKYWKIMRAIVWGIFSVNVLLEVLTPWLHTVFYFENNTYLHGKFYFIHFLSGAVVLAFCLALTLLSRRKLSVMQNLVSYLGTTIFCVAVLIQFFRPEYLLVHFATSVFMLVVYFSLQNPAEHMDQRLETFNLEAFHAMVDLKIERREKFGVLMLELSGISFVDQFMGRDNSNELLKNVAKECKNHAKNAEVFYLGANRFAYIFPSDDKEGMKECGEWLKWRFLSTFRIRGVKINLTARICGATYPEVGESRDDLINALEYTLHRAEEQHTDDLLWVENEGKNSYQRESIITHILQRALRNHEFEVYYQPIYDVALGRFTAAEALIRLRDEELGFIPPDEFIPIAERQGLILEIGEQIFRQVCEFIGSGEVEKRGVEYIEVNLSMVQCMQENLYEDLLRIMEEYDVPSRMVDFEITETYSVSNNEVLVSNMDHLISKGSTFAADDFGTGFATTTYLMDYPFKIIKLDKSFIWKAMEEEKAMNILRHTAGMIKSLNLLIVAEGVETLAQVRELIRMKVDFLQGFYFSKPLNQKDYLHFLDHEAIKYKTIEAD